MPDIDNKTKGIHAERGIHELYGEDAERADAVIFGRKTPISRRGFLRGAGLAGMVTAVGAAIPFADNMPAGLIPAAIADAAEEFSLSAYGKEGLSILNDRPINAETPPHLLDDAITPSSRMFVRNNGIPPVREKIDVAKWTLEIGGESCANPQTFSIADLKRMFPNRTLALQIECGGNGRAEYDPPAKGNQWTTGAVSCAEWTGIRLRDVLEKCGIKSDAVYTAYYAADTHLSGDPNKLPISRGVPMTKALEDESLIVWEVNGEDINFLNGYPLRVITAGWPGSTSGKWIRRIDIRNQVHDGPKMTGSAYRVPRHSVSPGTKVPNEDMVIIESMPVKSLVTRPQNGAEHSLGSALKVGGHAWAGDRAVQAIHISKDFGATWQKAELSPPANRLAWQNWKAEVQLSEPGYYEIWARATDDSGRAQPMVVPGWNPKGYLNNRCHRVGVYAA